MKIQDGNGSSKDNGFADGARVPATKIDKTINDDENPTSESRGEDELADFANADKLPVDLNAADVKKLMNEYLAKLSKGLRP